MLNDRPLRYLVVEAATNVPVIEALYESSLRPAEKSSNFNHSVNGGRLLGVQTQEREFVM